MKTRAATALSVQNFSEFALLRIANGTWVSWAVFYNIAKVWYMVLDRKNPDDLNVGGRTQ
jgi:hypothetical protein